MLQWNYKSPKRFTFNQSISVKLSQNLLIGKHNGSNSTSVPLGTNSVVEGNEGVDCKYAVLFKTSEALTTRQPFGRSSSKI